MATTPTTGDIPSNAAVDLKFNSEQFDRVMNSDDLTYTDRFGKKRITMKGVQELANGFQDTFTNLLGSPDGFKLIGGVKSFDTLRLTPVRTEGQRIFLKSYYENGVTGSGIFIGRIGTKLDDGGTVAQGIGYYWERIPWSSLTVEDFGAKGDGVTDDSSAILAAVAFSSSTGTSMGLLSGKTYVFKGSVGLSIDLGKFSFGCFNGRSKLDFSAFTGSNAINVFSSPGYPTSMYRNTTNRLIGLEVYGGLVAGVNGLLLGHDDYSYNGQSVIEHCAFVRFDNVILCGKNTWRTKFICCTVSTGITSVFNAPAGLENSGESVTFSGSQISDSNGAPIIVNCASFSLGLVGGTSVLNTRILINAQGATVLMDDMGNEENPGQQGFYVYADVKGAGARLIITSSTIVCNNPSAQTKSLFNVDLNAYIILNNVKMQGNGYKFEVDPTGDQVRKWISGKGKVLVSGVTGDPLSGAGNIPIHESLSPIRNWNFDSGDLSDWTINNSGSASQTGVVGTAYKKVGDYGLRLTSVAGLNVFATSSFPVRPGGYYKTSFWAKVVTANPGATSAGNLTLSFKTASGVQIISQTANLPSAVTDWAVYGAFICGDVPVGAVTAEISLRASAGAVVDFDAVLFNF